MTSARAMLGATAGAMRLLSHTLDHWLLITLALLLISPEGPHLRVSYEYRSACGERSYTRCAYLGSRGIVAAPYGGRCPVFLWLDAGAEE